MITHRFVVDNNESDDIPFRIVWVFIEQDIFRDKVTGLHVANHHFK